ncbi:hypothetical protein [Rhizobium sp. SSA_523]|uniref:hypothetical protein n=1 Tax=Rhizobium sp. SSA_523 TaxID=2952477 RepID=UPI002091110D|nr:hypothetical protein [Rhizobium sp. SSA_523]MCO5730001.1 hypothetical protein [Rhizobium sp. SSA_523]WKC25075.1 hypothetical protein QTJ18_13855 [Rhizobium sp. SSA_523]
MTKARSLLPALILLVPATALATNDTASMASTAERCLALGRQIAATPQAIGNAAELRSHAAAVTRQMQEIRKVRGEMARRHCRGSSESGSIIHLGASPTQETSSETAEACADLSATLAAMEENHRGILHHGADSLKVVSSLGRSETELREEMRSLRCGEIDYATIPAALSQETDLRPADQARPKESAITPLSTRSSEQAARVRRDTSEVVPERQWNPDRPVRMVGPQFFPDDSRIDLANPATPGAQPQQ